MSTVTVKENTKRLLNGIQLWNAWRKENPSEKIDLSGADLSGADLCEANLREANLSEADLSGAWLRGADLRWVDLRWVDLRGANIDFSAWPLWCGSFDVKVDRMLAAQFALHFCKLYCDDKEVIAAQKALLPLAKKSHRWET